MVIETGPPSLGARAQSYSTPTPARRCDLLIIGAGPAGLSAALAAAPSGQAIVVLDDNPSTGGQVWRNGAGAPQPLLLQQLLAQLLSYSNVQIDNSTRVVGQHDSHTLVLESTNSAWLQSFSKLILCTGARELFLPFPGWTLPGVTGAGGLQALIKGGMPVAGQRIVIAGSGPLLLAAAASAQQAGATVLRVAEQSRLGAMAAFGVHLVRWPSKLQQALTLATTRYRCNSFVTAAHGSQRLEQVQLQQGAQQITIACDRLAVGYGLVPNVELGRLLGCAARVTARGDLALVVDGQQTTSVPHIFAAGECAGIGGAEQAMVQGRMAAYAALGQPCPKPDQRTNRHWTAFARHLDKHFALRSELLNLAQTDTLICRCEDVPYGPVAACDSANQAKLQHRCGMGACQGRLCGTATRHLLGWQVPPPRPPLSPTRVATLVLSPSDGLNTPQPTR